MSFQPGDYVYPVDLPRRVLCRVTGVDTSDGVQILTLEALEKPWSDLDAPLIVRFDGDVRPAADGASTTC
jgi:hypothetical protein